MIAISAVALNFAFRQILLDQARLHIEATSEEIVQRLDTIDFFEPEPVLSILTDRQYLDRWAGGPTTYVQIDALSGYPIGKSTNMGSIRIPPHTDFHAGERSIEIVPLSDGTQLLVLDRLLFSGNRPVAIAHVAERLDNVRALVRRARSILIVVVVLSALVIVAASFVIAASAIEPIQRLTQAMSEIGSDRLDRRIVSSRTDEVGRLASAFNAMLARLQEAFARERQFISDASHELKTPLTVINANAQMLKRWGSDDPVVQRESIDAIISESSQLAGIVSGMLTLAKADSGDQLPKEPVVLERLIEEVVAHARDRAAQKGLVLEFPSVDASTIVLGDASLLRQLLMNLIDNAIKFTATGRVNVRVTSESQTATIDVTDTGIGISEATAERLFDRFYRGDPSHSRIIEGTGLGLAIVRSIARVHGGTVCAQPAPGGGAVFRLTLPLIDERSVIESQ